MKHVKIKNISRERYTGEVYNLELNSNSDKDDLFWIEQYTGVVSHNCFPKDINSMIDLMERHGIDPKVLKAVWEQNKEVRQNWDWANNPSAVSHKG